VLLTSQVGLNYICATAERFFAVGAVLGNMVVSQAQSSEQPSQRLLKHIIRCYLRLSDNPRWVRGRGGVRRCSRAGRQAGVAKGGLQRA
jgi:hypothetical protein